MKESTNYDPAATRTKILETAEKLFAEQGFTATSLRRITQAAGVNIAAVNYHFGSKDNLIIEILTSIIKPINAERIRQLEAFQATSPDGKATLEQILDSFCRPCVDMFQKPENMAKLRLIGRSMYECPETLPEVSEKHWIPLLDRYVSLLSGCLPHMVQKEIMWHLHFAVGAMIHTISCSQNIESTSKGCCQLAETETIMQLLIRHTAAGFRSGT